MKCGALDHRLSVLVWSSWVGANAGGQERIALELANGMSAQGCRVVLMGPYSNCKVLQLKIGPALRFVDFQPRSGLVGHWQAARNIRRILREEQIDVISAHGSLAPLLIIDRPVVCVYHGANPSERPRGLQRLLWKRVAKRLREGRWQLVGVSEHVRKTLCERMKLPAGTGFVIYNGVSYASQLRGLPLPSGEFCARIGLIGRMAPEKRPLDVFELDRLLQEKRVDCRFLVFGKGELEDRMRQEVQARGDARVELMGMTSDPAEALEQVDAVILLARGESEGLPTVLIEANLAGRPVVAWRAFGIPEATVDSNFGRLIDPELSLEHFAQAIEDVLRDLPLLRSRADDTKAAATGKFGHKRMIAAHLSVLRKAAEDNASE